MKYTVKRWPKQLQRLPEAFRQRGYRAKNKTIQDLQAVVLNQYISLTILLLFFAVTVLAVSIRK